MAAHSFLGLTAATLSCCVWDVSDTDVVCPSDEYRILVDMRWNKQYLDILASKCNFEDEERYMDFLEALNTVANRY